MKKKNLLKGLLASLMLLCAAHTWAYDFEDGNIQYTVISLDDLTVEVSGLTDTNVTEVVIPETVEYRDRTLTVTSTGSKAFQSNKTLESASISNTVTSIGSYAFDGCTALKEVSIGNGVTSIGSNAFRSCACLNSVTIPNSVTSIGEYAFYDCTSIETATIGNSVTSIGDYAFQYCSSLTSVEIPDNVTSIGSYVFADCSSLTEVTFPNSIKSIVSGMFSGCSSLAEITIPNSVTSIGDSAFESCISLKYFILPDNITSVGSRVLVGCESLEYLQIGAGIEEITETSSYESVQNITYWYYQPLLWTDVPNKMKSIVLNDTVTFYKMRGYGCTTSSKKTGYPIFSNIDVEYFYVGRPLSEIKEWDYTFYIISGSHNTRPSLYYETETFKISVSQPYGYIGTLEIGGYCTDVPYFYQSIENLILGEDVATYTAENIYQGNLECIMCKSAIPPTLSGTFSNSTYLNVILYVPIGSKGAYQAAEGWRNFWNIIEMEVDDMTPVEKVASEKEGPTISAHDGSIIINDANGAMINVYNLSGQVVYTGYDTIIPITNYGIYFVKVNGTTKKVLVQ